MHKGEHCTGHEKDYKANNEGFSSSIEHFLANEFCVISHSLSMNI